MPFLDRLGTSKDDQSTDVTAEGMSFREFNAYEASNTIERVSCAVTTPGGVRVVGSAYGHAADSRYRFRIDYDAARKAYR
jgi:hypothetical protein